METKIGLNKKLIRRLDLQEKTGLSKSAIYDRLDPKSPRYDPSFPRPVNVGTSAIRFLDSEADSWIEQRIAARNIIGGAV